MKLKWQINDEEPIIKELDDFDLTQIKLCLMPSTDVVEVVRCKDCKHYILGECEIFSPVLMGFTLDNDDYCSYGERREVE